MRKTGQETIVMNIGTSSMLVILIGLSFAVLAALAISSARNDYRLSEELAQHTTEYYEAYNHAQDMLADVDLLLQQKDDKNVSSFAISINDNQELQVEICFENDSKEYDIIKWKVVNVGDWEADTTLPVLKTP